MRFKIFITLFLLVSLFTSPPEVKAIPEGPRYCFRCTSGTFDDHRELMTGQIQYKLATWREDWVETDCLQAKGTFQYCEGKCVFVTVAKHLPDQQTYQAEGVLSDCADDLFRWGTDLPFFMGDRTSDNETLKTYTDGYEISFHFTLNTANYTEIYKDHVGQALRRHVYESYETSTVVIHVVVLAVIPFLTGCICFWCCLLPIVERIRRLNRRREYIARMMTWVPETEVIVEMANYNGGVSESESFENNQAARSMENIDESDAEKQKIGTSGGFVGAGTSNVGDAEENIVSESDSEMTETFLLDEETANAYLAGDVDSVLEHHHREKLYNTEESDIDEHGSVDETVEEPSDAKTIKDEVQELVYKL
ncbi:unnamed protein product [Caenorhabditis nigoni]